MKFTQSLLKSILFFFLSLLLTIGVTPVMAQMQQTQTIIQQAPNLGTPRTQAYRLLTQGRLSVLQKQWTKAENYTTQALNLAPFFEYPDIAYQLFWQLGRIQKLQKNTEAAISQYTQSIKILGSLRGDLVTVNPEVQFSFRESNGMVNKFIGDAVMALFGVPIEHTRLAEIAVDAENAVGCALAMADKLRSLNQQWQLSGNPTVAIRIGIATGTVVTGMLGN